MHALHRQQGATLDISILAGDDAQQFIGEHAGVLDSAFSQVKMSDTMRRQLHNADYIFSGIKTFHELNEAFPALIDENGNRKPFQQFLNDVQSIDQTYNHNYLRTEYNFAQASADMAARWEQFDDSGRYLLQYRTMGDDRVRPEHQQLDGITLPKTDDFWKIYTPPNGWGCRCTVEEVRRGKYPETSHQEAVNRAVDALKDDKKGMFRFNPGIERKTFPDYNPYTVAKCRDCDTAKDKLSLAAKPDNELCQACRLLHDLKHKKSKRRLNTEERRQVQKAALAWTRKHLPEVIMPDGNTAARLTLKTDGDVEVHVGKKFFNETFAKNKNNRRLAETMEIATRVSQWIKTARQIRIEPGRHHSFDFAVFRAHFNGQEIECKAKMTNGLILYLMRLI